MYGEDITNYGIVLIGGTETNYYKVQWNEKVIDHKLLESFDVFRDKRQKKGGQSAHRFQMNRLGQIQNYIKKICEGINKHFEKVESIFVFGSGELKTQIKDHNDIIPKINEKIKKVLSLSKMDINEALIKMEEQIKNSIPDSKQNVVNEFLDHVNRNTGRVVYGNPEVERCLKENKLEKIIMNMDYKYMGVIETLYETTNQKCVVTKVNDRKIQDYGGIVGILYYAENIEIE